MPNKILFIILAVILFGAGCKQDSREIIFDSAKSRTALEALSAKLGWSGGVIERGPNENNYYGRSYILNGPSRDSTDRLSVNFSSVEVIEFENPAYAKWLFSNDECFKGSGNPLRAADTDACCLNNARNGSNRVIMMKNNCLIKAMDYFHSDCYAKKYLEEFWKAYKNL